MTVGGDEMGGATSPTPVLPKKAVQALHTNSLRGIDPHRMSESAAQRCKMGACFSGDVGAYDTP